MRTGRVPSTQHTEWHSVSDVLGIEIQQKGPNGPFPHRLNVASDWSEDLPDAETKALAQAVGHGLTYDEHRAETVAMLREVIDRKAD